MSSVWLIARREIRERVKARSFRIATLISVAIVVGAIAIPAARKGENPTYDVGVVNNPGVLGVSEALESNLGVRLIMHPLPDVRAGERGLRNGSYDVVVAGDEILAKRAPAAEDAGKKAQLVAALTNVVRLQRLGPEAIAALQAPVKVRGVEPPDANGQQRFTAFVGIVILLMFLQQYGAWVLIGVIEEKASRVVEVLLAAVRPRQLVAGKVMGIGAVALMQGVIVAAAAIVTSQVTGTSIFEGTSRYAIAWTLVWFLLGYSLYAWAYAAVGSLVSRQADAQNAAFPLTIPIFVGYITASTLLSGGDPSPFAQVLSFVPLTAPMVMPMLIGLGKVAAWEIALSIGLSVATIALFVRLAGDIYSRAILHSGQRLKLRQVLRGKFTAV